MSSLSQRLKAIQIPCEPEKHSFDHLSMKDLEETKVDFGQTHRGKTYLEMWNRHQDWICWFLNRFEKSGKENHQRLIHFIELKIERAELMGEGVPQHAGPKETYLQPKMKAKASSRKKPQSAVEIPVLDAEEEDDPFEFLPEAEMESHSALEGRMNQMEMVLSQVLVHLEQQNVESQ